MGVSLGPPLFGERSGESKEDESAPVPSPEDLCLSVHVFVLYVYYMLYVCFFFSFLCMFTTGSPGI